MINIQGVFSYLALSWTEKIALSQVGWVDIVFVIVGIWAVIAGVRGGFVKEFSKFFSVLFGLFLTFNYYESLSVWLKRNSFIPQEVAIPLTYLGLLIVTILLTFTLIQILGNLIQIKVFQLLEKLGGLFLALARYALVMGLLAHFLLFFPVPFIEQSFKEKSITGPYLTQVCARTYRGLSRFVQLPNWQFVPQVTVK